MSPLAAAGLCAGSGLGLSALGVWLIKAHEVKPGESSFAGFISARSLGYNGGWLVLFAGLFLVALIAPMLYLKG